MKPWAELPGMMKMLENTYEKNFWPEKIIGIDEAGRGPLCGPLVVAGCILPAFYQNQEINDSKKLSAKKREELFQLIIKDALYYDFKIVSAQEIDRLNIYAATKKAMKEIAEKAPAPYVLSDAMPLNCDKEVYSIIKGDAKSISIAAASILAKVLRDHIMMGYDILYPQYELSKHKGYPTKKHLMLMEEYGLQDFYRLSYAPCQKIKFRN